MARTWMCGFGNGWEDEFGATFVFDRIKGYKTNTEAVAITGSFINVINSHRSIRTITYYQAIWVEGVRPRVAKDLA
jgi:hypothetical protein